MKTVLATTILAALCGSAFAGVNLASNGGFELGTGADSQDWNEGSGGAPGTLSERVFGNAASGDYAHHIIAVGSATMGGGAGITQNTAAFGLGSLVGGSTLQLSFDALTDLGPGGVAFYALRVLDRNGAIVADTNLQNFGGGVGYQSYTSAELTVPAFGADPSDFYSAFVEIVVNSGAFDGSFSSAYIDNVVISGTVVPAPGAMALLGLGGLVATRRRR